MQLLSKLFKVAGKENLLYVASLVSFSEGYVKKFFKNDENS